MKRSEMVYLIDQYLMKEYFEGHPLEPNGAWDSWKSSENILKVIEGAGMLAPYREKTDEEIHKVDAINQYSYCHRWESE